MVNPLPPAAVGSRNPTAMVLADVLLNALGQAAPVRAIAANGNFQGTFLAGWDAERSRYFVNYENSAGGQGGLPTRDGHDAMHVTMSNTSNLPIEAMEMELPLRVERYELIPNSGGAGRQRGGLGVCRDYRIIGDGIVLATRSSRQKFPAQGLAGGRSGGLGAFILDPDQPSATKNRDGIGNSTAQRRARADHNGRRWRLRRFAGPRSGQGRRRSSRREGVEIAIEAERASGRSAWATLRKKWKPISAIWLRWPRSRRASQLPRPDVGTKSIDVLFRPILDAFEAQHHLQCDRHLRSVAAGCGLLELGRDVLPRILSSGRFRHTL